MERDAGFESCHFSSSSDVPGTLISIVGALFYHYLLLVVQTHLFSHEVSGSERLQSGLWLHSFQGHRDESRD